MDMLVSESGNEYLLEVNTLPAFAPTSLIPKIAHGAGLDFGDLVEEVLRGASLKAQGDVEVDEAEFHPAAADLAERLAAEVASQG